MAQAEPLNLKRFWMENSVLFWVLVGTVLHVKALFFKCTPGWDCVVVYQWNWCISVDEEQVPWMTAVLGLFSSSKMYPLNGLLVLLGLLTVGVNGGLNLLKQNRRHCLHLRTQFIWDGEPKGKKNLLQDMKAKDTWCFCWYTKYSYCQKKGHQSRGLNVTSWLARLSLLLHAC